MSEPIVLKARPTTYNGIKMRSRLEARVAAWLDSLGLTWEYEPRAFGSAAGQYLPDFKLPMSLPWAPDRAIYLEVRGNLEIMEIRALEAKMSVILASEPQALLAFGDAWMLERGMVYARNHRRWVEDWADAYLVDILVAAGLAKICEHFRLPEYGA